MIELRPYQNEALEAIDNNEKEGIHRQLISLPTGTGKTILFCTAAKRRNGRTLILAHRDELIQQAVDKLEMVWDGASVGIVPEATNHKASSGLINGFRLSGVGSAAGHKR